MPFILAAFGWLRNSWLGKALAAAFAVLAAVFLIYRKGKSDARREQETENLENYIDTGRHANEARQKAAREVGALTDDELNDRLRRRGNLRE